MECVARLSPSDVCLLYVCVFVGPANASTGLDWFRAEVVHPSLMALASLVYRGLAGEPSTYLSWRVRSHPPLSPQHDHRHSADTPEKPFPG